ncbi:hypothetical protein ACOTVQ_00140 [Aliarcobacter butzleri]|uniref:hypothetical protein n=1 Tax=Aliarcobacter butzleri TaxID=28197 RepID=UPI00263D08CC|nr:hypothetical protein [Aliarcobacter butzleri]MDN5046043.1 hypothetical protein [Aliarcobacter butzleri]
MKYYVYTKTKLQDKIKQLKTYYFNVNVDADIINSFKDLENNSTLYIDNLTLLGDSVYKILNTLLELYSKNITLIVNERKINILNFEDIKILVDFEKNNIKKRLSKSRNTLFNQTSKRKVIKRIGRSNKSVFDKYKKLIFQELRNNKTQVSILNTIKKKNTNLNYLTPQALGQYIKKTKGKTIAMREKEYAMKSIFD